MEIKFTRNLRLILFVFSTLGVLIFSSCKKCATCTQTINITTKTSTPTPGYPQTDITTSTFEACGDNLKEVDGSTTESTASAGIVTVTSTSRTICN